MKLFPLLLAGTLLVPSAALAGGNNNGNGCRNRCGDTGDSYSVDNSGNNRGNSYSNGGHNGNNRGNQYGNNGGTYNSNNRTNNGTVNRGTNAGGGDITAEGGAGGRGGRGGDGGAGGTGIGVGIGQGGAGGSAEQSQGQGQLQGQGQQQSSENRNRNTVQGGDQRQSIRGSGNSSSSSESGSSAEANSNSESSSYSGGNTQGTNVNTGHNRTTVYGDLPETAVAPLPGPGVPGGIGDIVVPLPSVTGSVFGSGSQYNDIFGGGNNDRLDYGATIGINIPLGAGRFREYAEQAAQARADRAQFRLVQEAVWLKQQGILSEEAHPRHWAALNGN